MSIRIMAVDDEHDFLDSIKRGLFTAGYRDVCLVGDPRDAAAAFRRGDVYDVALIDITMPGLSGMELLGIIRDHSPGTECIMVTAVNETSVAVECMKMGAHDYLTKPVSRDDLVLKLTHAREQKRPLDGLRTEDAASLPGLANPRCFAGITTGSPKMLAILKQAECHAMSDVPVLITGESGTGKELLAKAVHMASPRARFPFMPVNMASLSPNLFDAEFFGHARGAFTGAEKDRAGYLECTNRGTLFLDEVGVLPLDLQGKLLRVLQEGEYIKIGTSRPRRTDVRCVAATNEDLEKMTARGLFRKDLYYRLKGAWLRVPPLRERREDIPLLTARFLEELGAMRSGGIDSEALAALMSYDFPGNIRELKAILHAAANLGGDRGITMRCLPDHLSVRKASHGTAPPVSDGASLADVERLHILKTYRQSGLNKAETARLLGIGINTLRRKLETYGEK